MEVQVGCDSLPSYREAVPPASLNIDHGKSFQIRHTVSPSPDTSAASTPNENPPEENGFGSAEEYDNESDGESDIFVKDYVRWLFDNTYEISYENKAKFGDLMKDDAARMSFAKYIDAQRSSSKCVAETTFYKLVHSFALVLFECGEADDYLPGKTLMNMSFTYYYIPDQKLVTCDNFGSGDTTPSPSSETSEESRRSKSEGEATFGRKNSFMQRFKKDIEQIFTDTPSFQELKEGLWRNKSQTKSDKSRAPPHERSNSENSPASQQPDTYNPVSKIFLYEHLKNQRIWKSLRFWNAAFFSAVHHERKRRCIQKQWTAQSDDEKEMTNESVVNITFGQLGSFINNMKCLGLDKKTCHEFLRKQSIIGGIQEDGQYYNMLVEQIEDDCTF